MKAALDRLGVAGVIGAGLLLFSVFFYLGATAPARAERSELQTEKDRLTAAAARSGRARASAGPAQLLPSVTQAPDLLKQLNALGLKDGVVVARSTYEVKAQDSQRILEVNLPLKVAYPMLRTYVRDVLGLAPTARLEELNLHRAMATDPSVDADLRFSFSFSAAS
jgi:hypothetical protein